MHAVERHAIGRRSGCGREGAAPRQMRFIEQPRPIHGANHDGRARPEQHEADRFERIVYVFHGLDPAAAQRVPDRRRHIETKRREP